MPTYDVDVGGATYEVDAPDPTTAWKWANAHHSKPEARRSAVELIPNERAAPSTPKPDRGIAETLHGTGEAALTALTGAIAAPVGAIGGLASGAIQTMRGEPSDAQAKAAQIAQSLTYTPGEAGQEQLQALGDALAPLKLDALGPMSQVMRMGAAAPQALQAARAIGGAAVPAAVQRVAAPIQRVGQAVPSQVDAEAARSAQNAISEGAQAGIDVLTSDVRKPKTFVGAWLESAGNKIPLAGTGPLRQKQQAQRVSAVRDVVREYGADVTVDEASAAVMDDLVSKRSNDIGKYAGMKNEVIDRLSEKGAVDVTNTVKSIDEQIAQQRKIGTEQSDQIISVLEDWRQAIQGKDLKTIEAVRKQIGNRFTDMKLTAAKSDGEKALNATYGPLRDDMGAFIKANGERRDLNRWGVANKRLSEMSGELKSNTFRRVLDSADMTPEAIKTMLFSNKTSDIERLARNLTPQGRAHARVAIISKASESAGPINELNPTKFANEVDKLGKSVGVMFSGPERDRVEGLARTLQLTKKAQEAAFLPRTGEQLVLPAGVAIMADMFGSGGLALASGATVGGLARLYESPSMRNMLTGIKKAKSGSADEAELARKIAAEINKVKQAQTTDKPSGKF